MAGVRRDNKNMHKTMFIDLASGRPNEMCWCQSSAFSIRQYNLLHDTDIPYTVLGNPNIPRRCKREIDQAVHVVGNLPRPHRPRAEISGRTLSTELAAKRRVRVLGSVGILVLVRTRNLIGCEKSQRGDSWLETEKLDLTYGACRW